MKQAKQLQRWTWCVDAFDGITVYCKSWDITAGEKEWSDYIEIDYRNFVGMFGRRAIREGQYVHVIIKQRADNKVVMRGWPYYRKWTQAEIDEVNARAERLWEMMQERNVSRETS